MFRYERYLPWVEVRGVLIPFYCIRRYSIDDISLYDTRFRKNRGQMTHSSAKIHERMIHSFTEIHGRMKSTSTTVIFDMTRVLRLHIGKWLAFLQYRRANKPFFAKHSSTWHAFRETKAGIDMRFCDGNLRRVIFLSISSVVEVTASGKQVGVPSVSDLP